MHAAPRTRTTQGSVNMRRVTDAQDEEPRKEKSVTKGDQSELTEDTSRAHIMSGCERLASDSHNNH
jgi:hypothetical protein